MRIRKLFTYNPVVFPCNDEDVSAIVMDTERLKGSFRLSLPSISTLNLLTNKHSFLKYCSERLIQTPRTVVVQEAGDSERVVSELTFPLVVKPAVKTVKWRSTFRTKALLVSTLPDWQELLRSKFNRDTWIVQEWVKGGDHSLYSCNCYLDKKSNPRVTFVSRKLRQWPPLLGSSSLAEEVRDDFVREVTLKIFEDVGLVGLGYLEIKREPESNQYYVIEANIGRPTGRSALAEAAGVQLLYTMYCDLTNRPLPSATEQRYVGAKWISLLRDTRSALHYIRSGELSIFAWVRSVAGVRAFAVFSFADLTPFVFDVLHLLRKLIRISGTRCRSLLNTRVTPDV